MDIGTEELSQTGGKGGFAVSNFVRLRGDRLGLFRLTTPLLGDSAKTDWV
jgi:hypothetical protein